MLPSRASGAANGFAPIAPERLSAIGPNSTWPCSVIQMLSGCTSPCTCPARWNAASARASDARPCAPVRVSIERRRVIKDHSDGFHPVLIVGDEHASVGEPSRSSEDEVVERIRLSRAHGPRRQICREHHSPNRWCGYAGTKVSWNSISPFSSTVTKPGTWGAVMS